MGYFVRLEGFIPGQRSNGTPWTGADIAESLTRDAVPVVIDTVPLVPLDADPENPAARVLETDNATYPAAWYTVTFRDGAGAIQVAQPVYFPRAQYGVPPYDTDWLPDAAYVRERSNISFAEYGYPVPAAGVDDKLQNKVDESLMELIGIFASKGVALNPGSITDTVVVSLIQMVLRMLVEFNAARSIQENLDTVADFDLLSSASAGPASESRRNLSANHQILHPWPALNKLLLMTIGMVEGSISTATPAVPMVAALDPMIPRAGRDVMDRRPRAGLSIYGDLPSPGAWRTWEE